jgi:hypothetical protein
LRVRSYRWDTTTIRNHLEDGRRIRENRFVGHGAVSLDTSLVWGLGWKAALDDRHPRNHVDSMLAVVTAAVANGPTEPVDDLGQLIADRFPRARDVRVGILRDLVLQSVVRLAQLNQIFHARRRGL